MSLFGRSKTPAQRFPRERWYRIGTVLPLRAAAFAMKHGLATDHLFSTRFFGGYLAGFPTYLDECDQLLAAAVRKGLFEVMFGQAEGQDAFRKIAAHLTLGDEQTTRGAGFGQPDGERFFEAVEANRDPYGEETFHSLDSALELGFVDFDCLI